MVRSKLHDERGNAVLVCRSFHPVSVLGLDGAATAGDKFNVFEDEKKRSKSRPSVLINA
jgi:translation initiation factor IF-2